MRECKIQRLSYVKEFTVYASGVQGGEWNSLKPQALPATFLAIWLFEAAMVQVVFLHAPDEGHSGF